MDQEKKNTSGAPSSDTTSALFVSARKKQLEQQEAERRAKEKEEQRLAAEAEVRRLEQDVEARRRAAEAEARRVEAEAAEQRRRAEEEARRAAEEARAKRAEAVENPDAILGAVPQKKEIKLPHLPKSAPKKPEEASGGKSGGADSFVAKLMGNKKLLAIIGGAVVLVIVAIILIATLAGGGNKQEDAESPSPRDSQTVSEYDLSGFYYLDGNENGGYIYIYSDGTADWYDADYEEETTGDYEIDNKSETLTLSLDGDTVVFDILSDDAIERTDTGETYSRTSDTPSDTPDDTPASQDAAAVEISGDFYLNGDTSSWCLSFEDEKQMWIYDPSSGWVSWEYAYSDGTILAGTGEQLKIFIIVDSETLKSNEGNYFYKMSASPAGMYSYHDAASGLSLDYPDSATALTGMTGDNTEILTIRVGSNYISFFDVTDWYRSTEGTDSVLLNGLMRAFTDNYFDVFFGGYGGIYEDSVKDYGADMKGEFGSIAYARIGYNATSGSADYHVYGELTWAGSDDLIIFSMTLTDEDEYNDGAYLVFNDILKSMRYEP